MLSNKKSTLKNNLKNRSYHQREDRSSKLNKKKIKEVH